MHYVYILLCADGTYYTGLTRDLEQRIEIHQRGLEPRAYTYRRRPVKLVWAQSFETRDQAYRREQQIKGWSHAKKAALIRGDFDALHRIVTTERQRREQEHPSRRAEAEQ
jgi:predicted GIY-YIG superfamily endonuclease